MSDTEGWKGRRAEPPGDLGALVGRLDDLSQRLSALETATPLQSASISAGGLTIKDGGDLTILDGGDVIISGGAVRIEGEEGSLLAEHPDGSIAVQVGPLWADGFPGVTVARGLLVQSVAADNNEDIFRALRNLSDGSKAVYVGHSGASGPVGNFGVFADDVFIDGVDTTYVRATAGFAQLEGSTGAAVYSPQQVQINSDVSQVFIQHGTTTDSANCVISTSGLIRRSTSSLRYKANVEDIDVTPEQVLAMRPVTFQDRGELEADPTTQQRYPGFIAEEIADLGLEVLVVRDGQGRPDALRYDRIAAAQQIVIRDHEARIADLEQTIAALAARLDTLEAS